MITRRRFMKNETSSNYIKLFPVDYYGMRLDDSRIGIKTFLDGELADVYKSIIYDNDEESITIELPSNFTILTPFLRNYEEVDAQYRYDSLFFYIELSEGFTEITSDTIDDWTYLRGITLPSTITSINCSNYSNRVNINNLETWCKINFNNKPNPASDGGSLFINNKEVINLEIPANINEISEYAFYGIDSIKSISILGNNTIFYNTTFGNCLNLETLKSYSSIPASGFYQSSIKYAEIYGDKIGNDAFCKCKNLTKVILDTVTIGYDVFDYCNNLYQIVSKVKNPSWSFTESALISINSYFRLYVPENCKNTYVNNIAYFTKKPNIVIEGFNDTEQLRPYNDQIWYKNGSNTYETLTNTTAFSTITKDIKNQIPNTATHLWLSDSIITIENEAFFRWYNLTDVIIGNSVTTIGYAAFQNCAALVSVIIPNSVTTIGERAFAYCNNIKTISIPNGVTTIMPMAFYDLKIKNITIPKSITKIGYKAFASCNELTLVNSLATKPPSVILSTDGTWKAFDDRSINFSGIKVPVLTDTKYKVASGWSEYKDIIITKIYVNPL